MNMASDNMHFRDPIIYRIILSPHWRTGDKWKVYPMYDFAHGQSDYFEGVTHSICTLEFVPHRPLYEKFVKRLAGDKVDEYCPRQIEFNRLNLTYTVMSKRKLLQLVKEGLVNGWDDPRMPTLCGLRRRGYPLNQSKTSSTILATPSLKRSTTSVFSNTQFVKTSTKEELTVCAPCSTL